MTGVEQQHLWDNRIRAELDGLPVWFIDLDSLKSNKRAVGRDIDKADLKRLG